jgi:hypothetical protein
MYHCQGNYHCDTCKIPLNFRKIAALFFAILLVRRHFWRINGKEQVKTTLRPLRLCGEKKMTLRMIR